MNNLLKKIAKKQYFSTLVKNNLKYQNQNHYQQTLKNPIHALTIDPNTYFCDDFFKIEQKKIFYDNWIALGYTNELEDNNIISKKINNMPIIITKNKNNEISAFQNVCRHRACKLVSNDTFKRGIVCPYHRWTYNLNGELLSTPLYKDQKNFNKKDFSLFNIKTQIYNNIIFGNINNNQENSIEDYFGSVLRDLDSYPLKNSKIVRQKEFKTNTNWKLLVDNFIEYYHLPSVHPELVKNSTIKNHVCTQRPGKNVSFKTDPLTSSGNAIDIERKKTFNNLNSKFSNVANFHFLFPNIFYFLFPNHLFSIILDPIAPNKTVEHATLIVENNSDEKWIDELWEFYDCVNLEDIDICEKVQQGLYSNQYKGGKIVPEFETTIHRFHNMIIEDITK